MAAIGDLYRVVHYAYRPSQQALNVTWWKVTQIGGLGSLPEYLVANGFHTLLGTIMTTWMDEGTRSLGVEVQLYTPIAVGDITQSTTTAIDGSLSGDSLPPQTAYVMSTKTGLGGRSNRGRLYLPFWTESSNDVNGKPTAGAHTLAAAMSPVLTTPQTLGSLVTIGTQLQYGIKSRVTGLFHECTQTISYTKWGTIRGRSHIGRSDTPPFAV